GQPRPVSWPHSRGGEAGAAPAFLGADAGVAEGGVGYYESGSGGLGDAGRGVELPADSGIGARWRNRIPRSSRRCGRDGGGAGALRRVAAAGGGDGTDGASLCRGIHLGARRAADGGASEAGSGDEGIADITMPTAKLTVG